jgi:hypothetical protein
LNHHNGILLIVEPSLLDLMLMQLTKDRDNCAPPRRILLSCSAVASDAQIKSFEPRIRNHPTHLDASKINKSVEVKTERPRSALGELPV